MCYGQCGTDYCKENCNKDNKEFVYVVQYDTKGLTLLRSVHKSKKEAYRIRDNIILSSPCHSWVSEMEVLK